MRFVRNFIEKGTLLFVSHDLNAVSSLCERAIWVNSGHVKMDTKTAPILTAYTKFCFQSSHEELRRQEETSGKTATIPATGNLPSIPGSLGRNFDEKHALTIAKKLKLSQSETGGNPAYAEIADWNSARDYGNQHAHITEAVLLDNQAEATVSPTCGAKVRLRITSRCHIHVNNFMAGFIVRNKTGMIVWGENNIGHGQLQASPGELIEVIFEFTMPYLMPSTYSMSVAISEGDENQPTVMHYKPDTITIEPLLGDRQVHGIFATSDSSVFTTIQR
jgi:lipopolysaccharide transport system ATP-binding protein